MRHFLLALLLLLPCAAQDTYYFDASDAAIADPNAVWSSDANGFDSNEGTTANNLNGDTGSSSSNYLHGQGTTAPTSGNPISQVRGRVKAGSVANVTAAFYTDALGESLGSVTVGGSSWSAYVVLATPTGGWTWQKVNDLEVKVWQGSVAPDSSFGHVEIEVTSAAPPPAGTSSGGVRSKPRKSRR